MVDNYIASLFVLNHFSILSSSHRLSYRHKMADDIFDQLLNGRPETVEDRSLTNREKFSGQYYPRFIIECMTFP